MNKAAEDIQNIIAESLRLLGRYCFDVNYVCSSIFEIIEFVSKLNITVLVDFKGDQYSLSGYFEMMILVATIMQTQEADSEISIELDTASSH